MRNHPKASGKAPTEPSCAPEPVMEPPSKRRVYHFSPIDDRHLLVATSFAKLQSAIQIVQKETSYPLRVVARRAKRLGAWRKTVASQQITDEQRAAVKRLLSRWHIEKDLLSEAAGLLKIDETAARKLINRDPDLYESLASGTYTLSEVAQGLCMRKGKVRDLIDEQLLQTKQLGSRGKLFIKSTGKDSIAELVRTYPRRIDWCRCMKKSKWLKDVIEPVRVKELVELLCVSDDRIYSWMRDGILRLPFNLAFFTDEPVFRFLDEYPSFVDLAKCSAKSPVWFAQYRKVQGRFRRKDVRTENERDAGAELPRYKFDLKKGR